MRRFLADILTVLVAFLFPWWVAFILAAALCFVFGRYYELLFLALLLDLLYGGTGTRFGGFPFILSALALVLFPLFHQVRKRMHFQW